MHGGLFVKLFLWFWLVMIAIGAALFVTQHYGLAGSALPGEGELLETAAELERLYAEEGIGATAGYLRALGREDGVRYVLLRREGRGPLGRGMPRDLREALLENPDLADGALRRGHAARYRGVPVMLGDARATVLALDARPGFSGLPGWVRLLVALVITALLSALLAAHLSRPIRQVSNTARRLAAGELDARVPDAGPGGDETRTLARDFNRMADRLQALLESRSQLLRDISHELRSPLARMQVALELARRDAGSGPERAFSRMELEMQRLDALIGQVLALGRLETETGGPDREPLAIAPLLDAVLADTRFEAASRRVDVVREGRPPTGTWMLDPALVRSALENVLRNAVRYSPEGTAVTLRLEPTPGWLRLSVLDEGPGIPDAQLKTVFEPFVRVSAARERGTGGHGLGLAIARHAVESLGGAIRASNRPQGGLAVELTLPLEADQGSDPGSG